MYLVYDYLIIIIIIIRLGPREGRFGGRNPQSKFALQIATKP